MTASVRIANRHALESRAAVSRWKHATFKLRPDVPTILPSRTQAVLPAPWTLPLNSGRHQIPPMPLRHRCRRTMAWPRSCISRARADRMPFAARVRHPRATRFRIRRKWHRGSLGIPGTWKTCAMRFNAVPDSKMIPAQWSRFLLPRWGTLCNGNTKSLGCPIRSINNPLSKCHGRGHAYSVRLFRIF